MPSNYLDALFMLAAGGEADGVLNRLFWDRAEDKDHGLSGD
jgi:hypothetical protein